MKEATVEAAVTPDSDSDCDMGCAGQVEDSSDLFHTEAVSSKHDQGTQCTFYWHSKNKGRSVCV